LPTTSLDDESRDVGDFFIRQLFAEGRHAATAVGDLLDRAFFGLRQWHFPQVGTAGATVPFFTVTAGAVFGEDRSARGRIATAFGTTLGFADGFLFLGAFFRSAFLAADVCSVAAVALGRFDLLVGVLELVLVVLLVFHGVADREGGGADDEDREPDDHQGKRSAGELLRFETDEGDDDRRDGQDAAAEVKESLVVHKAALIL